MKKVYIVEDQKQNIALYKAIFNKLDHIETFIESSGDKGLAMILNGEPDLIILDNNLPGMDGLSICRELRSRERFRNVPIIAVSSSPIQGNKEEIFARAGFTQLVLKPIRVKEFRAMILANLK